MQKVIEMNREEAREAAKVMLAYADGAEVQVLGNDDWCDVPEANFDWHHRAYRVKPRKPSINWDHVGPKFNWLAINDEGDGVLFDKEPCRTHIGWGLDEGFYHSVIGCTFASFDPGNCDWKDSLVERPK